MTTNLTKAPDSVATAASFRIWPGSQPIVTIAAGCHQRGL